MTFAALRILCVYSAISEVHSIYLVFFLCAFAYSLCLLFFDTKALRD
jgi:hypothetical protein